MTRLDPSRLLLIGLALVGAALIALALARHLNPPDARNARPPLPYTLPDARAFDRAGTARNLAGTRPRATAILYVDARCPHGHAELALWARLARDNPGLLERVDPIVVLSQASTATDITFIPPPLRDRVLHDARGEVGAALNVWSVPHVVYLDRHGIVRERTIGETDYQSLVRTLEGFVEEYGGP